MEREGIRLSRFSFSEEKPLKTKMRIKPDKPKKEKKPSGEEVDYSQFYSGFFLGKNVKEGAEKLASVLQGWNLKDFGASGETFVFVANPKATSGDNYYGLGGLLTFCCEVASRFVYEGLEKDMKNPKAQLMSYVDVLMQILEEDGEKQMKSISAKHDKSSEAFFYILRVDLKDMIEKLFEFYFNIVQSKVEAGQAQFYEVAARKVVLLSKESLIANEYDPDSEVNTIEAYIRWLRAWIYRSADKSFVLNAINDMKEEVVKFMDENNLSESSPSEVKSSLFMKLTSFTGKLVKGEVSDEDSALYRSFDRLLKMIIVKKGSFSYLLDTILGRVKSKGLAGLEELEEAVTDQVKVLLAEESFEISQTSTLFTEDIKAYDLLTGIMQIVKNFAPKEELKALSKNLSLRVLAGLGNEGVLSPVFQRVLDGLTGIAVDRIPPKGVIFYDMEYTRFFGSLVEAFTGLMPKEEVAEKRKYLLSIPIEHAEKEGADHFDPMTVLDMLYTYPEVEKMKKGKQLRAVIKDNVAPFGFQTSAKIITSGELKEIHFPMDDEAYYYLSEIVYSVIKDVYKNTYNSVEEIIFDTDRARTERAYKLMVERGIFENSVTGAFYFYRDPYSKVIGSIYDNYYALFFDWYVSLFGTKSVVASLPNGNKVKTIGYDINLGITSYTGHSWNEARNTYKTWSGKGYAILDDAILKELHKWSKLQPEEDRIKYPKPVAKSKNFAVLTGSIRNASRNIPYLFIQALAIKQGIYTILEKRNIVVKNLTNRILLEAIDGENYKEFVKEHKKEYEDDGKLALWDAFAPERLIKPLYTYGVLTMKKMYKNDLNKFRQAVIEYLNNIMEILSTRYLDDEGNLTQEFLEMAFITTQAFGFDTSKIKEAGTSGGITPYDDSSINDIENDIVTRLADEVYKDKIVSITAKEERDAIIDEIQPKKAKKTKAREEKKKQAEEMKQKFFESFGMDEEADEGELFDF